MSVSINNANTAPQVASKTSGETRFCAMDFGTGGIQGKLDNGETLSGTATVAVTATNTTVSTTTLTIANEKVSTTVLKVNGRDCAIGECIQWTASGGEAGTTYTISASAGTTGGGAAQTLEGFGKLRIDTN